MKYIFLFLILISSVFNSFGDLLEQSGNISVCKGEEVSLYVNASGTITSYKWYKDQRPLSFDGSNLIISEARFSDAGVYRCIISELEAGAVKTYASEPMIVDVNNATEIVDITRNVRIDGEEQIWTFHANVHDTDLDANTFRWEFDSSIGDINDVIGYSGINTNYLTVRFKYKENNFDYTRKLRFIANGDCGSDTALTMVESFNIDIVSLNSDFTACENEEVSLDYQINYDLPSDFFNQPISLLLVSENGENESKLLQLDPNANSTTFSFSKVINRLNAGEYLATISHPEYNIEKNSEKTDISYYPEIIITQRLNEPFSIKVGQPIKLRIWAEGSIAEYIWIKSPDDTLKRGDDPFYEVLASKPNDAGDYRCIMKSKCGDTTLLFTVVFKSNVIDDDISLSIQEFRDKFSTSNALIFDATGREVPIYMIRRGLYFIQNGDKTYKIIIN